MGEISPICSYCLWSTYLTCLGLLPHEQHSHGQEPPAHPTLFCLLQLLRGVTASRHFCLIVSAPCGPGSSTLSLPLWFPGQSLPDHVDIRLPRVWSTKPPNPTFFCGSMWPLVLDLLSSTGLRSYLLWPPDTEDLAPTAVG